ncbi:MAG: hypothetical protein JWN25_3483 [Verrucomicrobiales bacterium]|nr:hypothetical protein [Verrucomicrobiales bacterium]
MTIRSTSSSTTSRVRVCARLNSPTCPPLATLKQKVHSTYQNRFPEHSHLFRLALNEAEAAAQESGYPGLFFPGLAEEKTSRIAAWIHHQKTIKQNSETSLTA